MSALFSILDTMIDNMESPFTVVEVPWINSLAYSAGSKLQDASAPTLQGYTFMCWLNCVSVGWVGAPYFSEPLNPTSPIWSPTAKPATGGVSLRGYALMMKDELVSS